MNNLVTHLVNVSKVYKMPSHEVRALDDITLEIRKGEFISIVGPSGSGKSTLLYVLGMLIRPTSGQYMLNGEDISKRPDSYLSKLRNETIGFVFQSFHLMPHLNAVGNVELPVAYKRKAQSKNSAVQLLEKVGLTHRVKHRPRELSSGEMQRVAIARALVNDPSIILADEPTGNLDSKTGKEIAELLVRLNREGKTVVVVTHNTDLASMAIRVLNVKDGRLQ